MDKTPLQESLQIVRDLTLAVSMALAESERGLGLTPDDVEARMLDLYGTDRITDLDGDQMEDLTVRINERLFSPTPYAEPEPAPAGPTDFGPYTLEDK